MSKNAVFLAVVRCAVVFTLVLTSRAVGPVGWLGRNAHVCDETNATVVIGAQCHNVPMEL